MGVPLTEVDKVHSYRGMSCRGKSGPHLPRYGAHAHVAELVSCSYNVEMFLTNQGYGVEVEELLVTFDLIGVRARHMDSVKKLLMLTAFDDNKFPLCLEMPLFLSVVRAKLTGDECAK